VLVNGAGCSFKMDGKQLVLDNLPVEGSFELEIFTTCAPIKNTALSGPVRQQRLVFHPMRGRGLSAHHLFFGPP
jgi:aminopeptidase N